jgi:hypothetical protein
LFCDAVELRVDVAELPAVAADADLVAHYLQKLGAHLVTALARLHVHNLARRNSLEAGSKREKNGGEERRNTQKLRVAVYHGKQEIPGARAHLSRTGESSSSTTSTSRAVGAVQSALGVGGCGCEMFVLANVLIEVRQGRQRRDAVAAGEEQLGRCVSKICSGEF